MKDLEHVSDAIRKMIRENGDNNTSKAREMASVGLELIAYYCLGMVQRRIREDKESPSDVMLIVSAMINLEAYVKFYPDLESMVDWIDKQDALKWIQSKSDPT